MLQWGIGDSICANQTATLGSDAGPYAKWYTNPVGGNEIATGSTFTTPQLNANTTYYVSEFIPGPGFSAGAVSSAIGGGGFFNGNQSLIFNCTQPCILRTVDVEANSAGNRTIELRNSSGQILESIVVNIPAGNQTVTLDMPIPVGTDLELGTAFNSNQNLWRNNTGAVFPYTSSNGVISITGTTAQTAPTYYYFFYNWHVEFPGCESPRTAVEAEVFPDFDLDITNVPDYACTFQTSLPLSSNIGNGTWSADCIDCIDSLTGEFYPDVAGTGVWVISYTATNGCEKTVQVTIPVETCLSIEEQAVQDINIFPNPSSNYTTIISNPEIIKSIVVTDVSGKMIDMIDVLEANTIVDIDQYESGVYFFSFIQGNGEKIATKKFIKQTY